MTCATHDQDLTIARDDDSPKGRGIVAMITGALHRMGNAIFDSRQRQADREIARFLAGSGGRLTDDVERRMMRHLSSQNLSARE
jgi:hypothetical protein